MRLNSNHRQEKATFGPTAISVLIGLFFATQGAAQTPPLLVDQTHQWIPDALADDSLEKDIAVADVDQDGDNDIIIVRKGPSMTQARPRISSS